MKIMDEEEEAANHHHHHHHHQTSSNNSNRNSSSKSSSSNSSPEMKATTTKMMEEEEESESSPLRSPLQPRHGEEEPKPFSSSSVPLQSRHVQKPMSPQLHQTRHEEKEKPFSPPLHQSHHEEKEKEKPFSASPLLLLPSQQHYPQPQRQPPPVNPQYSTAMVAMDRKPYGFSNLRSPSLEKKALPPPPPLPPMESPQETVSTKPQSPVIVVNRSIRDELSAVNKMDSDDGDGFHGGGRRRDVEDGGSNRKQQPRHLSSVLSRQRNEEMVNKAALGFRVCALVFCLVSFSVMAADKTQGWAGDSFDRYKEYRYCLSVNTIGFVYASFQAYDLAYNLITEQHVLPFYIRYYFDFSMDQILTYLLISASSSAATRVDDWQTNWGKDEFTVMASASVGMSFMAFVAFAFSSLISGYNLCNRNNDNN